MDIADLFLCDLGIFLESGAPHHRELDSRSERLRGRGEARQELQKHELGRSGRFIKTIDDDGGKWGISTSIFAAIVAEEQILPRILGSDGQRSLLADFSSVLLEVRVLPNELPSKSLEDIVRIAQGFVVFFHEEVGYICGFALFFEDVFLA